MMIKKYGIMYEHHFQMIFNLTSADIRGSFTNYVDHLPPCVDIFYAMNVDKKWSFLDHLPTSKNSENVI